jgi:DNA repair photolyase
MKIIERQAKSILVPSRLPDADYVVNPYTGCQFGCIYCYATFTSRFVNEPRADWGSYVYVKTNAVELARKQLEKWPPAKKEAVIMFSSVTDPYQGIEHKYRLTRGVLQALVDAHYPGKVTILTKSPLVLRDVDLLERLNAEAGLTITTADDQLSRLLEVTAPLASRRLETLQALGQRGVRTYAFVGPLLPHFRYQPELLDELLGKIAAAGVHEVYVEHINLTGYIRGRLLSELADAAEDIRRVYQSADTRPHRQILDQMVHDLLVKHNLRLRMGEAIYHPSTEGRK